MLLLTVCSTLLLLFSSSVVNGILMTGSVDEQLQRLETLVGTLNLTVIKDIAGLQGTVQALEHMVQGIQTTLNGVQYAISNLQSRLQTEINERCQSGTTPTYKLECSTTSCSEIIPIHFNPAFTGPPVLQYGVDRMDSEHGMNVRYTLTHTDLTPSSVNLKVYTWSDTRLYKIGIRWIACPP